MAISRQTSDPISLLQTWASKTTWCPSHLWYCLRSGFFTQELQNTMLNNYSLTQPIPTWAVRGLGLRKLHKQKLMLGVLHLKYCSQFMAQVLQRRERHKPLTPFHFPLGKMLHSKIILLVVYSLRVKKGRSSMWYIAFSILPPTKLRVDAYPTVPDK